MSFGDNVKIYRTNKSMTQGSLANMSGLTLGQVSKIERGIGNPKLDTIEKLIGALECSASDLIASDEGGKISNYLQAVFQRADSLPDEDQGAIIHMIKALVTAHNVTLAMDPWEDPQKVQAEEMELMYLEEQENYKNSRTQQ